MRFKENLYLAKRALFDRAVSPFASELETNSKKGSSELTKLNWEKRVAIVEFAFAESPFYRRKYKAAGFRPGDLRTEADFGLLPPLERNEIFENLHEIKIPTVPDRFVGQTSTGGTTGTPLTILTDRRIPIDVISWRTLKYWGASPGENSGYLYRAVPTGFSKVARDVLMFPTRRCYISALDMTPSNMDKFYRNSCRIKSAYLVGYVGALEIFASHLESHEKKFGDLRFVWSTAAPLPQLTRKHLENTFGCPVYSQYGSCEFYWIAGECVHRAGLHIDSDIRHVEAVDTEGRAVPSGELGDILVTDFLNRVFPLIRYRIGDRGRLLDKNCGCGSLFPLMDYVRGRCSDVIILPNGDRVPGEFWTTIFDDFVSDIRAFAILQSKDRRINVVFDPRHEDYHNCINAVKKRLVDRLGADVPIEFTRGLPITKLGGKTRYVVSELT